MKLLHKMEKKKRPWMKNTKPIKIIFQKLSCPNVSLWGDTLGLEKRSSLLGTLNVPNATELFTVKWLINCYMDFSLI